jgi:hypothetical protein
VTDRDWIIRTMLNMEATDGEVDAAANAATPAEIEAALQELDLACWWQHQRELALRGAIAHMREQHPGIDAQG